MKAIVYILLSICIVAGCKPKSASTGQKNEVVTPEAQTVTEYEGVIPCADCSGIRVNLRLSSPANTFEEKSVYMGKSDEAFTKKGNYNIERGFGDNNNATVFILNWDKPVQEQSYYVYYSSDPATLHKLNPQKELIQSELNYTLKRK